MAKKVRKTHKMTVALLRNGGSSWYEVAKGKRGQVKVKGGAPHTPDPYEFAAMNVVCVLQAFPKRDRAKVLSLAKKVLVALEG